MQCLGTPKRYARVVCPFDVGIAVLKSLTGRSTYHVSDLKLLDRLAMCSYVAEAIAMQRRDDWTAYCYTSSASAGSDPPESVAYDAFVIVSRLQSY